MVFQEGALFPHLTVAQNVGYSLRKDADRTRRSKFAAQFIGAVDFLPASITDGQMTCELGGLGRHGNAAADLSDGHLEVMFRPDCLECYADDHGPGVIAEREFQGAFCQYRVRLPSGREVRCLMSHIAELPVGAAVSLRLREGHRPRLFVNGRRVGAAA